MTISLEEREEFVNKIKVQLEMCNYGFQVEENSYVHTGYDIDEPRKMKAIRELLLRLEVWKVKGKLDRGSIKYSEAKRRIDYILHEDSINKCKVNLIATSK